MDLYIYSYVMDENMKILIISDKEHWNEYIRSCHFHDGGFLQSWQWGEFQEACKRRVLRIGEIKDGNIIFGWQAIEMPLLFELKYWYVPRPIQISNFRFSPSGGLSNEGDKFQISDFFSEVITQAKKERVLFLRIDGGEKNLKKFGFQRTSLSVQPQEELIVDITKSEEALLAEMKPKTRYNVRVAQKHNVEIRSQESGIMEKFDQFYELIELTSMRQGIRAYAKEYYRTMLEVLGPDKAARLYTAEYEGKIVAASIMGYFNGVATYLHGGTDDAYKNVMAPYLLHWQAILDAKAQGYTRYNFGGLSSTKKSWEGITRFKTGFSPNTEFAQYAGVWDAPSRRFLYRFYRIAKAVSSKL